MKQLLIGLVCGLVAWQSTTVAWGVGACCHQPGTCAITTQPLCEQELGVFQGENTACTPNPCPPILNDICANAIPIPRCTSGITHGALTGAQHNYDPGTPGPGCLGGGHAWGPDVVYRLDLHAGETADLTYTALDADGAFYIVTDCANVSGSCVAGADNTLYREPEHIVYTAPLSAAYYVILDGSYQNFAGAYDLAYGLACANASALPVAASTALRLRSESGNPFRGSVDLGYDLPAAGAARIAIFDASGRLVRTLLDRELPAGHAVARWDGRDGEARPVGAGVYYCRLASREGNLTLVLVKAQ